MIYKTLLFDLDSTVWDFHSAENYALTKCWRIRGQWDRSILRCTSRWIVRCALAGEKQNHSWRVGGDAFCQVFDHFGLEKDGHELASEYEAILSTQGQTIDGAEEMLHTLSDAGYELYAATNGITTIQKGRLEHSPVTSISKKVFISEELKVRKTKSALFSNEWQKISRFRQKIQRWWLGFAHSRYQAGLMRESTRFGWTWRARRTERR